MRGTYPSEPEPERVSHSGVPLGKWGRGTERDMMVCGACGTVVGHGQVSLSFPRNPPTWQVGEPSEPEWERISHSTWGTVRVGRSTRAGTVKDHVNGLATRLLGCGTLHMAGGAGLPLSGSHCHLAVVMNGGLQGEAGDGSHPRVLKGTIRAKPNRLKTEENVE